MARMYKSEVATRYHRIHEPKVEWSAGTKRIKFRAI